MYASGSPMPLVKKTDGSEVETAQCNNFYCFPGIGFGAHFCGATEITDMMIVAVSNAIAAMMTKEDLTAGRLLPDINDIRRVSSYCALGIIRQAEKEGKATKKMPSSDEELLK